MLFKPEELVFTSVIPQEELKQLLLQLGSTTVNEMKHQTTCHIRAMPSAKAPKVYGQFLHVDREICTAQ